MSMVKQIVRRVAAIGCALMMTASLAACNGGENPVGTKYPDKEVGFQLDAPAKGDTVAVIHTSMGDISVRFFPEAAPKAVKNFTTHAKNGYYNGLTFHRVMNDFMIQGGDPKGDGTGGESIWGSEFEDEFDTKLLNLRGSLAMANSGVNTNGSQFFINQNKTFSDSYSRAAMENTYKELVDYYGEEMVKEVYPNVQALIDETKNNSPYINADWVTDEMVALYKAHGGNMHLDGAVRTQGGHTVFGQVYDGMDVVDAIAAVATDDNDAPVKAVTIESIDVTTY